MSQLLNDRTHLPLLQSDRGTWLTPCQDWNIQQIPTRPATSVWPRGDCPSIYENPANYPEVNVRFEKLLLSQLVNKISEEHKVALSMIYFYEFEPLNMFIWNRYQQHYLYKKLDEESCKAASYILDKHLRKYCFTCKKWFAVSGRTDKFYHENTKKHLELSGSSSEAL